jgi:iron complex outermembrane recepter protein
MFFFRNRPVPVAILALAVVFQAAAARAQHASDNPVTAADDAYGLTLGLESVGLYNPGLIRGFSPQAAGNLRIDGLYFDEQGGLSNRVVEGSTIRVGVSEIGYAFPAPTGIVDFDLRHPGGDEPSATVIASVGPYEARGISVDGSIPLIGAKLVLPIGVSTQLSTSQPYGSYPGYTSRVTSAGAAPQWTPNNKIKVRALFDYQNTSAARTFPVFFTAGNYLPPPISKGYVGQDWAKGRATTLNLGALADVQMTDAWSLKAGFFRSINDSPTGFADLYTDIQPGGQSDHLVIAYPDQNTYSTSGETRLTGTFVTGALRHQLMFMVRGRDTTAHYGGEDTVDLGPATIGAIIQAPEPDFVFSPRAVDHSVLWSAGTAYHLDWRGHAELELGIQHEIYHETVLDPASGESKASTQTFRAYGNAAFALTSRWTIYTGYTQGLEGSGAAPSTAVNSGAVLPASLTWQADAGVRYAVTPKFKIIAGVFELEKPYFNFDSNNIDRELGQQKEKAIELSIAGEPLRNLHVNIGILDGRVNVAGSNLAAEGVGSVAVGQPRITYVADVDYTLPWWPAASLDLSATHFGVAPESIDNNNYLPAASLVNFGGRYKFTAFGENNTLRIQVQNVIGSQWWSGAFTPGFFPWPGPRTVFAYLTTDIQ